MMNIKEEKNLYWTFWEGFVLLCFLFFTFHLNCSVYERKSNPFNICVKIGKKLVCSTMQGQSYSWSFSLQLIFVNYYFRLMTRVEGWISPTFRGWLHWSFQPAVPSWWTRMLASMRCCISLRDLRIHQHQPKKRTTNEIHNRRKLI